jgi:hypothetical protein
MHCQNCGNYNNGGKFCIKCGTKLEVAATSETVAPTPIQQTSSNVGNQGNPGNQQLNQAKQVSKLYFKYFVDMLKNPTKNSQNANESQFMNGIITMVLYALCIPLMLFFGLRDAFGAFYEPSFADMVMKPAFFYLLFIGFIDVVLFAILKISRVNVSFKGVTARYGSFLVVPTAFLIIALLLSLVGTMLFMLFLLFGFLGLFIVVAFVLYSYKKDSQQGLDPVYGTFISYLSILILFAILGQQMIESFERAMGSMFFPF